MGWLRTSFASGLDRAHYFKGMHVLLEAARMLKERRVRCRVWIVGEGKMRKEYEEHAREIGVLKITKLRNYEITNEAHVEFLGLVPHEKMPDY